MKAVDETAIEATKLLTHEIEEHELEMEEVDIEECQTEELQVAPEEDETRWSIKASHHGTDGQRLSAPASSPGRRILHHPL